MDSGNNSSTHEESSKIANEEDSNIYQGLVARNSRPTLQPAFLSSRLKSNRTSHLEENKNNETLPIKRTIATFNFKIVLIGNVSVGKSSIIRRFVHNDFNNSYLSNLLHLPEVFLSLHLERWDHRKRPRQFLPHLVKW